jgi:hypothetical protein
MCFTNMMMMINVHRDQIFLSNLKWLRDYMQFFRILFMYSKSIKEIFPRSS